MPTERDQTKTIEQASRVLCRYVLAHGTIRRDIRGLAGDLLRLLEARDSKPVVTGHANVNRAISAAVRKAGHATTRT